MANELGTGGLLGALTGKAGANAPSTSSHHTAMVTGASGRAKDAAAPMITIGNMTVNNDSSDGSVIKTVEKNNQYKPADTSTLKMGGFFSTATGKLESAINKQTELIEKQSAAIIGKLEGVQAAVVEMNQAINKAMNAQISLFEEYSAFDKKQNAKTTLLHDVWMLISSDARRKEAATKSYYNANQPAAWSKSDTFSLTKTIPNALAKINENLVTRFTDPKVKRTLISETLKHYQRVYKYMQDIIAGIENIRYNTHPIEQYVNHEFDVYNRAHHLGIYNPRNRRNNQQPPRRRTAKLIRTRNFDTLTSTDIAEALEREVTFNVNGTDHKISLKDAMKILNNNKLNYNAVVSDRSYIKKFLYGHKNRIQQDFKEAFFKDRNKKWENQKKDPIDNISDKNLKALIAPTEELTKATMLSASSNGALQSQMKHLGLAVDTNTSTVEEASSAMSAAMKLFTRFVNFKSIGSILFKLLKFYSIFRTGKSILGLVRGGIGLASSGFEKISSGFNWLKDRVPFVKSISDAISGWWDKAKNYFHEKIGSTIETYVTKPIVGKITNLFDGVFGSGSFDKTLTAISNYSKLVFTTAFGKDPAERERAWSTLKNGITNGFENIVKKYIIPAIAKVTFAIYSWKNLPKTVAKIPGAFSTAGKMWREGIDLDKRKLKDRALYTYNAARRGNLRKVARGVRGSLGSIFNGGKLLELLPGGNYLKEFWNGSKEIDAAGNVTYKGGFHQGLKDFSSLYTAVTRGISNAIHGTGVQYDNNGNVIGQDTSSKLDLYKSIEKLLHSTGSAPKKVWESIKATYTGIKNNTINFGTIINNLKGKFSNLGTAIVGLPGKFKDMKTAFGGFGGMLMAGGKGLGKGIWGALGGGTSMFASLVPLAKGLASLATGVGIPIAIIAFLIKMILPAFRSAQTKGVGVGQYLKDTIIGWFEKIKKTLYTEVGGFGGLAKMVMSGIVGVLEGLWIGIKSLFNANSAAGLIFNIGKVFLDGIIALIPLLFKMVAKGIKIAVVDIPRALLWDLPKMIIDAVFGGGGKSKKSNVVPHAKGGIVDSPTYFKFAKGGTTQTGLMGEAGPEAILKLKKGKDGVLGVSIADSSNSLQQAIKLLDRTNAVTSTAMRRLTDAITRPNSFYDPKTVKQFTSTFKKLDISSDRLKLLSDVMTRNAGKEVTVDNINELVDLLNDINTEQTAGNKDAFKQGKALNDSQTKANKDQSKRDTERNKTLTDSQKVSKAIKENLPEKGFWDKFAGWWEGVKQDWSRDWDRFLADLGGDYSNIKTTDAEATGMFGISANELGKYVSRELNAADAEESRLWSLWQTGINGEYSEDLKQAIEKNNKYKHLYKIIDEGSLPNATKSDIEDINNLIGNYRVKLGFNPSKDPYNADNLVKILAESKKLNKDTIDAAKIVLETFNGVLNGGEGDGLQAFMAAINKTPDFSIETLDEIKKVILDRNGEQVTDDTMKKIVEIVDGIKKNQEEETDANNVEQNERKAAESAIQKQIRSIKEYFVGGKFFADIDKAKMTVGGIMKTIGSSIYNLVTGKQNAVIGNALKDTFGAGFGGLAAGLMGDSRAYEFISKINANAVKHGHSDVQRMMTSARHTILSDVSDIAQFTKDTKITSEELASILEDAKKYGWNINAESFKKLDAQIKGIPYVPEGKDGKTNTQAEGTSAAAAQGSDGKVVSSNNAGQILIHTPTSKSERIEFDARHLDGSSKASLLDSIKRASDTTTSDQAKATYSKLSEAVSTGRFESLSSSDWETLKDLSPKNKDAVSKMQGTINKVRFETYTHKLLNSEGGLARYVDKNGKLHEDNRGISRETFNVAISKGIIPADTKFEDLTAEQAIKIYKDMYWDVKDGPKMYKLPHPIDYLVYDTHVNGGALNVLHNTLKELGVNGYDKAGFDKTFDAVIDYCQSPEKTKKFGETFLIARGKYYIDIVKRDNTKSKWLQGWFQRLENISKQTGLESPFKDGSLVDEANKLLNELGLGKSTTGSDSTKAKVDELVEQPPKQATTTLVKDYGGKILGYDPYKKVADEIKAEQAKNATATSDSTQSKTATTSKQPANAKKSIKVADGYLDFVENMIHETELDRQGRSRMDLIKMANSGEPTDISKIESLKNIRDELTSGSISASTMEFLNENEDNFEAYRSWNARATQFKMSDAARSGLIELLKKKQAIASKGKDGGLFTSNSTMVKAKRAYEAFDRAIKEVQTDSLTNASMDLLFGDKDLYRYVKNLSYQPTDIDETFSKEIPDSAFDLSKTAEKSNIKYQQMVQQALAQVTDEDFKKDPYTALQNAVDALREATALQYVALTKMERPNVANVNNATVSTNSNSSVLANQSNVGDSYGHINPLDAWMSGSNAILSSSQYWSL